jgi:hypothetical protein
MYLRRTKLRGKYMNEGKVSERDLYKIALKVRNLELE